MELTQKTLDKYSTLDELIDAKCTTKEGIRVNYSDIGSNEDFKKRFNYFKGHLKEKFPDFTNEEILKFHYNYKSFQDYLYGFSGFDFLLEALDFETNK